MGIWLTNSSIGSSYIQFASSRWGEHHYHTNLLYSLLLFIIVCAHGSNRLEAHSSSSTSLGEHEIKRVVSGCKNVSGTAIY